jgi:hypothetical protein
MKIALCAILAGLALVGITSPAHAVVFNFNASTAQHPVPSSLSLQLLIPLLSVNSTLGPVGVSGTGNATTNLDLSNSGTLQINSSTLNLSNFGPSTVSLGALGTIDASLSNVGVSIVGGPVPVTNRNFVIDSTTPGSLAINSGSVVLNNATGVIAGLLSGPVSIDFSTNPINIPFSSLGASTINGSTDDDTTGLDPNGAEVNIPLDATVEVTNLGGIPVLARLFGNVNLGSSVTAIPEVGSLAMLAVASAAAAGLAGIRRMRSR